jgi:hypothetical protein
VNLHQDFEPGTSTSFVFTDSPPRTNFVHVKVGRVFVHPRGAGPLEFFSPYRYVEYNVIGGGMRMIFDSKSSNLFLSCHYSAPALVTASGAGEQISLEAILKGLKKTHKNLKNHSEGVNFGPGMNTRHLETIARADPPFKGNRLAIRI